MAPKRIIQAQPWPPRRCSAGIAFRPAHAGAVAVLRPDQFASLDAAFLDANTEEAHDPGRKADIRNRQAGVALEKACISEREAKPHALTGEAVRHILFDLGAEPQRGGLAAGWPHHRSHGAA